MDLTKAGILPDEYRKGGGEKGRQRGREGRKEDGQEIVEGLQKNDYNYGPRTLCQEKAKAGKKRELVKTWPDQWSW